MENRRPREEEVCCRHGPRGQWAATRAADSARGHQGCRRGGRNQGEGPGRTGLGFGTPGPRPRGTRVRVTWKAGCGDPGSLGAHVCQAPRPGRAATGHREAAPGSPEPLGPPVSRPGMRTRRDSSCHLAGESPTWAGTACPAAQSCSPTASAAHSAAGAMGSGSESARPALCTRSLRVLSSRASD